MLASSTSFNSSDSDGLDDRFLFFDISPETESRAAPNGWCTWLRNCPIARIASRHSEGKTENDIIASFIEAL